VFKQLVCKQIFSETEMLTLDVEIRMELWFFSVTPMFSVISFEMMGKQGVLRNVRKETGNLTVMAA